MPELFQDTFDVKLDEDVYTFKAPPISYEIQIGYRSAEVRRKAYPEGMGSLGLIDMAAVRFARGCAILELYLVKATTGWPFGITDDANVVGTDWSKPPEVKFENFPDYRVDDVYRIEGGFEEELARFRQGRDPRRRKAGTEGVDSGGNSGAS